MNNNFQLGRVGWSPNYNSNKPQLEKNDVPWVVRLSTSDLKSIAGARCCDIYDVFSEDEAKLHHSSIYEAWKVGRNIRSYSQASGELANPELKS